MIITTAPIKPKARPLKTASQVCRICPRTADHVAILAGNEGRGCRTAVHLSLLTSVGSLVWSGYLLYIPQHPPVQGTRLIPRILCTWHTSKWTWVTFEASDIDIPVLRTKHHPVYNYTQYNTGNAPFQCHKPSYSWIFFAVPVCVSLWYVHSRRGIGPTSCIELPWIELYQVRVDVWSWILRERGRCRGI